MAEARAVGHSYAMEYRWCLKAAGLTYPVALCRQCGKVIPPASVELSRTGAHGTLLFLHEHELCFAVLVQSNSGKRRVEWRGDPGQALRAAVERAWVTEGASVEEVVELIASLLAAH